MGKLTELSDAQRRSLAKLHLTGTMMVDMVGFSGLELDQLRHLFQSPRMKRIIGEEQAYLDTQHIKLRNRMSYGLQDSIDRMKARGNGIDGPQLAFMADKFLIEQILPKQERHVVEQRQTFSLDAQVAVQFSDAVSVAREIVNKLGGGTTPQLSKYTLTGLQGVELVEPETVEIPRGNGSSPTELVEADDESDDQS